MQVQAKPQNILSLPDDLLTIICDYADYSVVNGKFIPNIHPLYANTTPLYEPVSMLYMIGRSDTVLLFSFYVSDDCSVDTCLSFEYGTQPTNFIRRTNYYDKHALCSVKPRMFMFRYTELVRGQRREIIEYTAYCQKDNGRYIEIISSRLAQCNIREYAEEDEE